jgi:hypothetical protein
MRAESLSLSYQRLSILQHLLQNLSFLETDVSILKVSVMEPEPQLFDLAESDLIRIQQKMKYESQKIKR